MRQIVLDTETTGLSAADGHRIIEIGCLELVNRRPTGETWHRYIHPQREIDAGAVAVHGITLESLEGEPRFAEIASEFLDFVRGAELIIHNAPFDVGFIDAELRRLDPEDRLSAHCGILDSLEMARERHPGQRNSLDALCDRYEVDNSNRTLHGALLDAELLAEVYLRMTGGQVGLALAGDHADGDRERGRTDTGAEAQLEGVEIPAVDVPDAESEAHQRFLDRLEEGAEDGALWRRL